MQELLVASVEFPDLRMVKIKAEHPIPSFNNLVARLDEQRPSNWDIPLSPEQYIEEIRLGEYNQAMLAYLDLEVGAVPTLGATVPKEPLMEPTSTVQPPRHHEYPLLIKVRRLVLLPQRKRPRLGPNQRGLSFALLQFLRLLRRKRSSYWGGANITLLIQCSCRGTR